VRVEGLSKTYPGGVDAVQGVEFTVEPGEVFGLIGPNGAGKSTTIGMLTTTVVPSAGRAWVAGFDVVTEPIRARRWSAVVSQDPAVDRALSGRRNLDVHARLWGMTDPIARVAEVIDAFGLGEFVDRPVATLSGGQRRRLEIARALLSRPRVLFLDEPTVGLDPRVRHELLDLIGGLRAEDEMTVVVTTHYLDEADRLCDRVAVMSRGRIAALDTPSRLRDRLGERLFELRVDRDPEAALAALRTAGVAGDDAFVVGQTVTVPLHDASASPGSVIGVLGVAATELATRRPSLDDVYLQVTGERLAG
jgi:ABC-2 type transport system ATP-binding protein